MSQTPPCQNHLLPTTDRKSGCLWQGNIGETYVEIVFSGVQSFGRHVKPYPTAGPVATDLAARQLALQVARSRAADIERQLGWQFDVARVVQELRPSAD